MSCPRAARLVTVFAEHRAPYFWLKRNGVVTAAIVADDLKTLRRILAQRSLFRAAFRAPLRRHHVPLVIHLLIFFTKDKDLFALNTRDFDIWHSVSSGR